MLIAILAHIIVMLGVAALAAITVTIAFLGLKKLVDIIKKKLKIKVGGTVAVMAIQRVAKEAIADAEKTGNIKNLAALRKMAESEGVAVAVQDSNGNISKNDIEIYQAEQMDQAVYNQMDEDGMLLVTA